MSTKQNQESVNFTVSAPGKVILHGEHSVVFNKLAIAGSLDIRTYVHLEEINPSKGDEDFFTLKFESLNAKLQIPLKTIKLDLLDPVLPLQAKESEFCCKTPELIDQGKLQARIEAFVKKEALTGTDRVLELASTIALFLFSGITASVNYPLAPIIITLRSDVTPGSGTGSSASLAVALVGAFIHYIKLKTATKENISKAPYKVASWENIDLNSFSSDELSIVCKWAYLAECIAHGKPSGIDNTVSTYGSIVLFRRGTRPRTLPKLSGNLRLLLINTKVPRNTKVQVAKLCDIRSRHEMVAEAILDAMDKVAREAGKTLQILDQFSVTSDGDNLAEKFQSNFKKLEELAHINQNLLRVFGLSHPKLDEVCSILSQHNLVGKLTGAGGGGNAISYVPPNYTADQIMQVIKALQSRGFEANIVSLGGSGVQIHSTDLCV